jgi:crotonobetainyl-CoA:carnitine CoA-transferase CaiB-like acyl-CoA transferase
VTTELPLTGVRVVDHADEKAELAGRLLADLGADVIRIEPPGGAASRRIGPFHCGESLYFAVRNTNKRGLVLDLHDGRDRATLLDLLAGADIFIDTSRPGELAPLGLDPRQISARFPELVVSSITDFGLTGPYRHYVATDPVMVGMAWMLFRAGVPELPPVLPPGSLAYDTAGITGAFASLTGLLHRLRTGRGQLIDLSVIEAVQQTTDWGLASYSVVSQMGTYGQIRSGGGQIYPVVPCKDGWVRPSIVTKAEWRKMRAWLGEPDMLQDDHWDATTARIEIYYDVIEPLLVERFAGMTMVEASEEGQRRRIPITPLLRPGDVLDAEHYKMLGTFADGEVDPGVEGPVAAGFYLFDDHRVGFRRACPTLDDDGAPGWTDPPARFAADLGGDVSRGPFVGVRVLDFGVAGAAPEIGRLLGEYGADVIRVESPHRPDLFRQLGGPGGVSPVFASSSRTKRSFGVDFRDPEGVALVKGLVARSDIVVENLPPGVMEGFGLGWDELRAVNADLVMISSQTMGSKGPWTEWRGYGANTQPPGGMTYLWSFPGAEAPVASNVAFPDHVVGRLGAAVAAALLIHRERRDAGLRVEIVQAEVAINLLADLFLQEALDPGSVGPAGNRSPRGAPWGVYRCSGDQRWCVITCRDDRDWERLRLALGSPRWADDPVFGTADGRRARHDELDAHLSAWTGQRTDREVMETLQAAGVPAGMMMYVGDIPSDPHLIERGYVLPLDQPGVGDMLVEGPSFHSADLPGPITTPAPRLGEHTREIAAELLGVDEADITRLVQAGTLYESDDGDDGHAE